MILYSQAKSGDTHYTVMARLVAVLNGGVNPDVFTYGSRVRPASVVSSSVIEITCDDRVLRYTFSSGTLSKVEELSSGAVVSWTNSSFNPMELADTLCLAVSSEGVTWVHSNGVYDHVVVALDVLDTPVHRQATTSRLVLISKSNVSSATGINSDYSKVYALDNGTAITTQTAWAMLGYASTDVKTYYDAGQALSVNAISSTFLVTKHGFAVTVGCLAWYSNAGRPTALTVTLESGRYWITLTSNLSYGAD